MESFGQKIKKALTRNLSKKHIERSTTNQSNHSDEKSDEPDISPRIKGPKASVNKAFELVGCCITYTQIFKNAQGNELDPKRQGLNRDFGRVCVVTPEIAVIAIADGCGLQYWSEISARIAANELVMYMQQSLERRNRPLSVNEVKKRLKKAVLEVNDALINARNPVNGEALAIAEQGGATTLMIAAVLPLETDLGGGTRWGVVYLGMGDSELYLVSEPHSGMPQSVPSSPRGHYNETATVLTRNRSNSDAPKLPGERRSSVTKSHPDEKKEVPPASTTIVVNNVEEDKKVDGKRMSNSYSNTNAPKESEKGRSVLTNSADRNRTQPKVDLSSNKTSNSAELPSRMSLSSEDKRKFLVHRKSKTDLVPRGSNSTEIKVNPPVDSPPHSSPTPSTKPDKSINTNATETHWRKSAPPPNPGGRERSQTETEQPQPSSSYLSPNNNVNSKSGHHSKSGTHGQPHPTKIWTRICGDNGTSRFLPFVGLGERHIPEPGFVEMNPGDILIACSDGLKESFAELRSEPNQPQDPIALELPFHEKNMDAHKAFENWCRELMIHSYCCHKENNTHPDDVTIAAIRISETIHGVPRYKGLGSKGGYPHVEPTEDVTKKIDPLFYSFVEDYWKSDPLPSKASEYHVKTNKRSSKAYSWEYTDNDKF